MSKDFIFFSSDKNDWNYNKSIGNDFDPFNENKKSNENENYNIHKYNCIIMLKEILKNSNYNIDLLNGINKKAFCGGSADYWNILNITVYTFYYNLFKNNNDIINYKDFRKFFLKNPLYIIKNCDKKINDFEGNNDYIKEYELHNYIRLSAFNKILNKVVYIEDEETKKRYIIISMFLKNKILDSCALAKLCQIAFFSVRKINIILFTILY